MGEAGEGFPEKTPDQGAVGGFQRRLRPCVTGPGTGSGQEGAEVRPVGPYSCAERAPWLLVLGTIRDCNRSLRSSHDAESLRWGQESVFLKPSKLPQPYVWPAPQAHSPAKPPGDSGLGVTLAQRWQMGRSQGVGWAEKAHRGRAARSVSAQACFPPHFSPDTLLPSPPPTPQSSAFRKGLHSALQVLAELKGPAGPQTPSKHPNRSLP